MDIIFYRSVLGWMSDEFWTLKRIMPSNWLSRISLKSNYYLSPVLTLAAITSPLKPFTKRWVDSYL